MDYFETIINLDKKPVKFQFGQPDDRQDFIRIDELEKDLKPQKMALYISNRPENTEDDFIIVIADDASLFHHVFLPSEFSKLGKYEKIYLLRKIQVLSDLLDLKINSDSETIDVVSDSLALKTMDETTSSIVKNEIFIRLSKQITNKLLKSDKDEPYLKSLLTRVDHVLEFGKYR